MPAVGFGRLRSAGASLWSSLLAACLAGARRGLRWRGHLGRTGARVAGQVGRATTAGDSGSALFGLLGYRLWWTLRQAGAPARSDQQGLVVIGGAPRSGTTLLRSILGRHPDIHAGPETTVFLRRISSPDDLAERLGFPAHEIAAWQRASRSQADFIERCAQAVLARSGRRVWAEKTPHNVGRFGYVRRRFPRAKLVHIVRDGRDMVCSLRREPFNKAEHVAWDSPAAARHCAVQWRRGVSAGLRWRSDPAYFELRYEHLVQDPEPVLRALLAFIGLPWDDALLAAEDRPVAADPHEAKAAGRIFGSSIGRWRQDLSEGDKAAIRPLVAPLLERLGYEAF